MKQNESGDSSHEENEDIFCTDACMNGVYSAVHRSSKHSTEPQNSLSMGHCSLQQRLVFASRIQRLLQLPQ